MKYPFPSTSFYISCRKIDALIIIIIINIYYSPLASQLKLRWLIFTQEPRSWFFKAADVHFHWIQFHPKAIMLFLYAMIPFFFFSLMISFIIITLFTKGIKQYDILHLAPLLLLLVSEQQAKAKDQQEKKIKYSLSAAVACTLFILSIKLCSYDFFISSSHIPY